MSRILAIETSLQACAVAIQIGSQQHYHAKVAGQQQSHHVLELIAQVLAMAKVNLNQLDALAFAAGPGSFTGIRLAASVAQGIAFAGNLPVIPVSTLRTLAQVAHTQLAANLVMVATDAHRGDIYWGVYQLSADGIMHSMQSDARCKPIEAFARGVQHNTLGVDQQFPLFCSVDPTGDAQAGTPARAGTSTVGCRSGRTRRESGLQRELLGIGEGWRLYQPELQARFPQITIASGPIEAHAQEVAKIGTADFLRGNYVRPEAASPNYLLDASSWSPKSPSPPPNPP